MAITGDTGNQVTMTFAANMGFGTATTQLTMAQQITQGEHTVPAVDVTTLLSTPTMQSMPGDLRSIGESSAGFKFLTTVSTAVSMFAVIPALAGSVVITYPLRTGETTSATFTGTAFLTGFTPPTFANGELQVGEIKWQYDGDTGPTFVGSA